MLFVTNRMPKQSLRSRAGRNWVFDMSINVPSPSVFFCERGPDGAHRELMSREFLQRLKEHPAKHVLLFIHGFNNSPDEVFERVEEIQGIADIERPNFVTIVPVIWPADAEQPIVAKYYADRDAADESRSAFSRAIQLFMGWQQEQCGREDQCVKPISILAHSMGNRVLRETLFYLQDEHLRRGMPRLFHCVFMSAADVVNECLERGKSGEHISDASARVVVYYAYDDLALRGSKAVNIDQAVSRRLGHTGPERMGKVEQNVYALDCGAFNTKWDPPNGHTYYGREKGGAGNPSPLLLHALKVMEDLRVPDVDPHSREGRLTA